MNGLKNSKIKKESKKDTFKIKNNIKQKKQRVEKNKLKQMWHSNTLPILRFKVVVLYLLLGFGLSLSIPILLVALFCIGLSMLLFLKNSISIGKVFLFNFFSLFLWGFIYFQIKKTEEQISTYIKEHGIELKNSKKSGDKRLFNNREKEGEQITQENERGFFVETLPEDSEE